MADDPLLVLRRDPLFARSLQFLLFFGPAFPGLLPEISEPTNAQLVLRLEWLLVFETDRARLSQPFLVLLKPLAPSHRPSPDTLLEVVRKEYRKRQAPDVSLPPSLLEMTVQERCRLLFDLTEFHLSDPQSFRNHWQALLKDGEGRWRIDSVGQDSHGRSYFVFDDGRLYRSKRDDWELLAASRSEWNLFFTSEAGRKSKKDKQLLSFLQTEILPDLEELHDELEREERRLTRMTEVQATPRKRSSRLQALKEAEKRRREEVGVEEEVVVEVGEEKRRRVGELTSHIAHPPHARGKSREERLQERELKKLLLMQTVDGDASDASDAFDASDASDLSYDSHTFYIPHTPHTPHSFEPPIQHSPLKLILKRTEDGYESVLMSDPDPKTGADLVKVPVQSDTPSTSSDSADQTVSNERLSVVEEATILKDLKQESFECLQHPQTECFQHPQTECLQHPQTECLQHPQTSTEPPSTSHHYH